MTLHDALRDIRPARPDEAAALTELSLRSKAYWGYDAEFMADCRAALAVTPADIAIQPAYALEAEGRVVGFYTLKDAGDEVELDALFVEPDAVGRGLGARLWRHSAAMARALGYRSMLVESDPNAEGFYAHMGMTRCGERESSVRPGRKLPLLRVALDATAE